MKKHSVFLFMSFVMISILSILSGCASTEPSRFYALNSLKAQDIAQKTISSDRGISIALSPVNIPDYLDRPQIVSRTSQNELFIDEFNRWAGSLSEDITRVLAENLSILLPQEHMSVLSWERTAPLDYRIVVDVTRFDVMPDDNVLLKTQWIIFGKDGKNVLAMRESNFNEHVDGKDYSARVAAMSRALAGLSRDIADEIKSISKGSIQ
jgi:hypothetical protein